MKNLKGGPAKIAILAVAFSVVGATAAWGTVYPGSETTIAWFDQIVHWTIRSIELAGIAVIVIGAVMATVIYLRQRLGGGSAEPAYHRFRASLGRGILLGLEFLVAADIIATVAVEPSLNSVAILAGIVFVRTFLSFALEVEIEGRWPWQSTSK